MKASSPTFADLFNKLDADPNVHLTIRDPVGLAETHGAPSQFVPGKNGQGTILLNGTTMNQQNYDLIKQSGGKPKWIHTGASVLGHELGHAGGHYGYLPKSCAGDPAVGGTGCIIRFENRVREDVAPASGGVRDSY
jgi:hypothetical protein